MPIAYNAETGKALRLDDSGQWVETKIAKNQQTGETLALDGNQWAPLKIKQDDGFGWGGKGLQHAILNGLTLGGLDHASALASTLYDEGKQLFGGDAPKDESGKSLSFSEDYGRRLQQAREPRKEFEAKHPVAGAIGELAGGLLTPAGPIAAGRAAVNAATAAPGLLARGLRTVLPAAGLGAVAGATSSESLDDIVPRALTGGVTGGLVGGGIHLLSEAAPAIARGAQNIFGGGDPERTSAAQVARALSRDTPNATGTVDDIRAGFDRLQQLQADSNGAPVTLMDTGPNAQRLGRTVQTVPGEGSRTVTDALNTRQGEAGQRALEHIDDAVGSRDQYGSIEALNKQRKAAAAPLYEKAYAAGPVHSDRLARMAQDPIVRDGIRKGLEMERIDAAAEGRALDPHDYAITGFDEAGAPIGGEVPNMRLLDAGKRGLDAIIDEARDPVTGRVNWTGRLRSIDNLRRAYVSELDKANPDYAAARAAWAGPTRSADAVAAGRSFLKGDIEQMDIKFDDLTPADRDYFLTGMGRAMQDMVQSGNSDMADVSRRLLSPKVKERLQHYLGKDAYEKLIAAMKAERSMAETRRTVTGGSPTARLMAEQDDAGQAQLGFLTDLASGGLWKAGANFIKPAVTKAKGLNEGTAARMGQMLTTSDPAALQALRDQLTRQFQEELIRGNRNMRRSIGVSAGLGSLAGMGLGRAMNEN